MATLRREERCVIGKGHQGDLLPISYDLICFHFLYVCKFAIGAWSRIVPWRYKFENHL